MTMFRNLTIFRAHGLAAITDAAAQKCQFMPCASHEDRAIGWTPPRGVDHGALVETVAGHTILTATLERKRVPGGALRRAVEERCKAIEDQEGFRPGRKRKQELKEDVRAQMLGQAIPTRTAILVWVDPTAGTLAVDAVGAICDDMVTLLVKSFDGLRLQYLLPVDDPQARMSGWLVNQQCDSDFFSVGRDADLVGNGGASVRLRGRDLREGHVTDLVGQGMQVSRLEILHEDATFVLAPTLELRRIRVESPAVARGEDDDPFDADVMIGCTTMRRVISDLMDEFGGMRPVDAGEIAQAEQAAA